MTSHLAGVSPGDVVDEAAVDPRLQGEALLQPAVEALQARHHQAGGGGGRGGGAGGGWRRRAGVALQRGGRAVGRGVGGT